MTAPTDNERTAPAIVQGSERSAYAIFVEDAIGDLVDILYYCRYSACADSAPSDGALLWPGFDFGDSGAYCEVCHGAIDLAR